MTTIFFDIGDTLATPAFDSSTGELIRFDVLSHVTETLSALKQRKLRMGIISNAGSMRAEDVNALLDACGLLNFFDKAIIIYRKKDSPKVFAEAAAQAATAPAQCLFVGENRGERKLASMAGLRVVASPALVLSAIEKEKH